jgi:hypothetical protein
LIKGFQVGYFSKSVRPAIHDLAEHWFLFLWQFPFPQK